jgi:hypothetical protein
MVYILEYFDNGLNQTVTHEIKADTTKKAVITAGKILENKSYSNPDLYEKEIDP